MSIACVIEIENSHPVNSFLFSYYATVVVIDTAGTCFRLRRSTELTCQCLKGCTPPSRRRHQRSAVSQSSQQQQRRSQSPSCTSRPHRAWSTAVPAFFTRPCGSFELLCEQRSSICLLDACCGAPPTHPSPPARSRKRCLNAVIGAPATGPPGSCGDRRRHAYAMPPA